MPWKRLTVWAVGFVLFALGSLPGSSPAYAETGWQLRRQDRHPRIVRRLKGILRNKPLSGYAFRQLMKYHRKNHRYLALTKEYRKLVNRYPKHIAYKLILARILRWRKHDREALPLLQQVRRRKPRWTAVTLEEAACLLRLKRRKEAISRYKSVLAKLSRSKKRRILKTILREALKASDGPSSRFALEQFEKLGSAGRHEDLAIARLLMRHKYTEESLRYYEKALKRSRGGPRVNLLLEICRIELDAKRYKQALKRIEQARQVKTTLRWLRKEILAREIEIYRRQKRLPELLNRLAEEWKNTKSYDKIILLARLYHETQQIQEGTLMDKHALKIRPRAREPRLRLIKWYAKMRAPEQARHHLQKLIKYKGAEPRHYLDLAFHMLKQTKRRSYTEPPWSPIWASNYRCRQKRTRRKKRKRKISKRYRRYRGRYFGYRYYGYRRWYNRGGEKQRARCSRQQWNQYRRKRLRTWAKQFPPRSTERSMLQKSIHLLSLCMARYPKRWEPMRQIYEALDRHGYPRKATSALRKMLRATGDDLHRITHMQRLLFRLQRPSDARRMLIRAMRSRHMAPLRARDVVSYIYRGWLHQEAQRKQYQRLRKQHKKLSGSSTYRYHYRYRYGQRTLPRKPNIIWRRSPCPHIRRLLRSVIRRMPQSYTEQKPTLTLQLGVMAWACGAKERKIQTLISHQEKKLLHRTQGAQKLLTTYIKYKHTEAFDRLLGRLANNQKPAWILSFLRPYLKNQKASVSQFLLQRLHKRFSKKPALVCRFIEAFCRDRKNCLNVRSTLNALVASKNTPSIPLLRAIRATTRFSLFTQERLGWLKTLQKRHEQHLETLQWMAEQRALFTYVQNYTLRRTFGKLHRDLLLRVLSMRMTPPHRKKLWYSLLTYHLRRVARRHHERYGMLQKLEQVLPRYPSLNRQLLGFFLNDYRYHSYGRMRLRNVLSQQPRFADILLLQKYYFSLGLRRQSILNQLIKKINRPEELVLLELFGRKFKLFDVQIRVLRKLLKMRPKDTSIVRRLAQALDAQKDFPEADRYWLKLLRLQPQLTTMPNLRTLSQRCCADEASQRYARRLYVIALERHTLESLWPTLKPLLAQLKKKQQSLLLAHILKHPRISLKRQLELAEFAYQKKLNAVAVNIYKRLLRSHRVPALHYRRLALLLEQQARFQQATPYWNSYLRFAKQNNRPKFFRSLAKQFRTKGKRRMAQIAFYRALSAQNPGNAEQERAEVIRLQASGRPMRAWARWLWLQGKQGLRCLRKEEPAPKYAYNVPLRLWKLNTEYRGPLLFFNLCQWSLPPESMKLLVPLANYMKKHPKYVLHIRGSADDEAEVDVGFLARQRANMLRSVLVQQGIARQRVQIATIASSTLCNTASNKQNQISCQAYRRQISIGNSIFQYGWFLRADADQDGTNDAMDQCPMHPSSSLTRRRYRYRRYRYRRRYYSRKRLIKPHKNPQNGCPKHRPISYIKGVQKDILKLIGGITFYRSGRLRYNAKQKLTQLAAYLQLAPHLGQIQIEYTPQLYGYRRRYGYYRYRYRRRYGYYRYRYRRSNSLSKRRARAIHKFLISKGVPRHRLVVKIVTPTGKPRSRYQSSVVFRILKFVAKPTPKPKPSSFQSGRLKL